MDNIRRLAALGDYLPFAAASHHLLLISVHGETAEGQAEPSAASLLQPLYPPLAHYSQLYSAAMLLISMVWPPPLALLSLSVADGDNRLPAASSRRALAAPDAQRW